MERLRASSSKTGTAEVSRPREAGGGRRHDRNRLAMRLADRVGLEEAERVVLYYSGLLAWVGCHTDAYEQAKWFGDDIAMKAAAMDGAGPVWALGHLGGEG